MSRLQAASVDYRSRSGNVWQRAFRSLQFKASLVVVMLVILVAGGGLALSLTMSRQALYSHTNRQAVEWANSLASGTAQLIERKDKEALAVTVNDLLWSKGVVYVAFADQNHEVLASGEKSRGMLQSFLSEDQQFLSVDQAGEPQVVDFPNTGLTCVDVVVPVYGNAPIPGEERSTRNVIGYLRMATDISAAQAQLVEIGHQLQRIFVAVVLLVAPCCMLMTRKVVSPLNELSLTARAIADGVMDARAKVNSQNEIGELAYSFNEMADRLAETQFEMLKLNAELEERVQQRTRELEDLASRDGLTGLYNRRHFSEVSTREFAAAERYDADLAVIMIDLDHFKETNDLFGHRMGDQVLKMVADCISQELREPDVPARFGGDEFILLLPQSSAAAAHHLAERIIERFSTKISQDLPKVPTTLSIGIASLRTTRARSSEALIHDADQALYAAKEGGRNRAMAATAGEG